MPAGAGIERGACSRFGAQRDSGNHAGRVHITIHFLCRRLFGGIGDVAGVRR